jgi:hypothetical protein
MSYVTLDVPLDPEGVDRRLHGLPGDAEESGEFLAGLELGTGLELAREDRRADGASYLDIWRTRVRAVDWLHVTHSTCLGRSAAS